MDRELKYLTSPMMAIALPAAQALISGVAVGVVVGILAALGGWDPWRWGGLFGGLVFLGAWVNSLSWWRSTISPMQAAPEPAVVYQAQAPRLHVSIDWDEGRSGLFDELNISDELFITWACGVAGGKSLGENHWTGAANPFSKGQYHAMIDRLVFHGIVKRAGKGKSSGFILSGKGRAVCNAILGRYGELPSPAEVKYLPGR